MNTIGNRTSIRTFKNDDISKEIVEDILNHALALGYVNQNPKQRPIKELKDIVEWYGE